MVNRDADGSAMADIMRENAGDLGEIIAIDGNVLATLLDDSLLLNVLACL